MKIKTIAYILQPRSDGFPQLLFHSFDDAPSLPWRLPGGGVDEGETVEAALFRELKEEAGLTNLDIVRKLGIQHYYKPYIQDDVERHDYLLRSKTSLPDSWSFNVNGLGGDAGARFHFHWLTRDSTQAIDPEHGQYLTYGYIPEFFTGSERQVFENGAPPTVNN